MELELLAAADDRVAGVVAALEADDRGSPLGEEVDDLPLALVAPLGADYDHAWHAAGDSDGSGRGGRVARQATLRRAVAVVGAEERQRIAADLDQPGDRAPADLVLELLLALVDVAAGCS